MLNQTSHPSNKELTAFLAGQLDDAIDATIDQHVACCAICLAALDRICNGNDDFPNRIIEIGANSTLAIRFDRTKVSPARQTREGPSGSDARNGRPTGLSSDRDTSTTQVDGNRYRFAHELDRGGMGIIYAGHDDLLQRELVMKVLNPQDQADPAAIRRFMTEARICGGLQHPGIVPIHDLGRLTDERPFFTMKRVEGQTLRELLAARDDPSIDQARFIDIFSQVCQTLAFAHSQSVIHRDLKPDNIMIGAFGEVQVLDWGLAKRLGAPPDTSRAADPLNVDGGEDEQDANGEVSISGNVMGTPAYMSPEQAEGRNDSLDKRTDVFALGSILCEILTGQPPYGSNSLAEETAEQRQRTRSEQLLAATERLARDCDDQVLAQYCQSCLAPNADARPSDASCLATAMLDHRQSIDRRVRQAEIERSQNVATMKEQRKRQRIILQSAFTIFLLAFALIAGLAYHRIQSIQRETTLSRETQKGRELSTALDRQQNDYARAMMLATNYHGDNLKQLLRVFDQAAAVCRPAQAADRWLEEPTTVSSTEREFVHRLFEAHVWLAADATGDLRQNCLNEAQRAYRSAFTVFASWHSPGEISVTAATKMLEHYGQPTQAAAVNAIDDWARLLKRRQSEEGIEPASGLEEWLRRVADDVDTDSASRELRQLVRERNVDALLRLAQGAETPTMKPAFIHGLACALEMEGEQRVAARLLDDAHRDHADAFWLSGRILLSQQPRPTQGDVTWKPSRDTDLSEAFLLARENTRARRYELALQQFAWIFRDATHVSQQLTSNQLTHFLFRWLELGQVFPDARDRLIDLRESCEVELLGETANANAFPIVVAINSLLMCESETVDIFKRIDTQNPQIAELIFPLAQSSLGQNNETQLLAKYALRTSQRVHPRLIGVGRPTSKQDANRRLELVITLVACLSREGHQLEALEVATDARVIWPDAATQTRIERAIDGAL